MLKVKNNPDLRVDPRSGAVINTNIQEMKESKKAKLNRVQQKETISRLENDVGEIKALLNKLMESK